MKYVIMKVGTMSAIDTISTRASYDGIQKGTTNDYSDKIRECSKTINSHVYFQTSATVDVFNAHKGNKKKTHQKSRTVFLEFLSAPASIRSRAQSA